VVARALSVRVDIAVGHVHSAGRWSDHRAHQQIAATLDPPLRPALRPSFEWYLCRGAFFHTDAHYANVLFGIWYIDGPPVDIAFARARVRVGAEPGTLVLFDPFEVHGVLQPGALAYQAEDYRDDKISVFAGFELELDASVRASFDMSADPARARVVSSATRVSSASGTLE